MSTELGAPIKAKHDVHKDAETEGSIRRGSWGSDAILSQHLKVDMPNF